ncbi:MAG: hypothetical protein AB4206_06975 [Xenococcaceae cyanobacterium]
MAIFTVTASVIKEQIKQKYKSDRPKVKERSLLLISNYNVPLTRF